MKNKINLLLFAVVCLIAQNTKAQKEDRIWVFPDHCGIDFNNLAAPDTFTSALDKPSFADQCALADSNGNLFCYAYSNTFTVYSLKVCDRNHTVMPNGSNMLGHPNLASLLLPYPGKSNLIGLFHIGKRFANAYDLYFSTINKNLNNGFGDVEIKDSMLYTGALSVYKLAAVRHGNGRDWWILINHVTTPGTFVKYLFTPDGVDSIGIQQFSGSYMCGNYGRFNFSRDGTKFMDIGAGGCINVFDFDRCTGQLSNLREIGEHLFTEPYQYFSGEFSPNGNVIYVSAFNFVKVFYQYDLNAANIKASKLLLNQYPDTGSSYYYNHVLAPDNKIYISRGNYYDPDSNSFIRHHLDVIEYPDSVGLGCHYIQNGFNLGSHYLAGFLPYTAYFGLGAAVGSICDSITTTVQEVASNKSKLEVYPNPSHDYFSIGLTDANDLIVSWKVNDLLGKNVLSSSAPLSGNFDLSDQPAGVYFLQVLTKKKKVITVKVMKE